MSRIEQVRPPDPWPPPPRLDGRGRLVQDDYEPTEKARQLLKTILPKKVWIEFEERGVIQLTGKRGIYVISPYTQTEIRDLKSGRCVAHACLQLSTPAPSYDRVVAEYLLIKNDENLYWKTANIFSRSGNEFNNAVLFLIAFDFALFANLLLSIQ
ncbi:MAG: hypothetical protein Q8R34_01580 [bacterium]|nr:hypothetical protein [bacterium]